MHIYLRDGSDICLENMERHGKMQMRTSSSESSETAGRSVLLSLCIPTYNRETELRQMLENLLSLDIVRNGDKIEIVISDNASTDGTEGVAKSFTEKYPGKVRYFKNDINVEDRNFGLALSRGRGEFLKLSNDTLLHTEHGLQRTLDTIDRWRVSKPVLCFRNNCKNTPDRQYDTLDGFWRARSFYSTWIAEFGTWRSDFTSAKDFSRLAETHLSQVDFLLRLFMEKHCAVIAEDAYFNLIDRKVVGKGYVNCAQVFGINYFDILMPYVEKGLISRNTFIREKRLVFRWLIINNFLITRPGFMLQKTGFFSYCFKYYKTCWYFWLSLPFVWVARIITPIRRKLDI